MGEEVSMQNKPKGRRIRVRVKTSGSLYIGNFFVPELRTRLSDVLNDRERDFISLTDVLVNSSDQKIAFVCLNKHLIESIEPYE
ncbi:MAG: hypothetical protein A3J72_02185 [Nitrospirae bacterium RIFCSPHIGHO2_02_FULL_40_19]|nr:MAG: hypothetical protein A3J72_02185 [Nitrospirae bacterium RIFCSPHIGHO2_02_FULL_40_19]